MLKGIFVEGLSQAISHSMKSSWGLEKSATVHDLVRHTTSLKELERASYSAGATINSDKADNRRGENSCKGGSINNVETSGHFLFHRRHILRLKHQLFRRLFRYGINSRRLHCICILRHRQRRQSITPAFTPSVWRQIIQ